MSSPPCRAFSVADSVAPSAACSGRGSHTRMNGAVSVRPSMWVTCQPSSPSMRAMVAAAGGAPDVSTRTPRGTRRRSASGPLAMAMSTVGAAHSMVAPCSLTCA